MRFAAATGPTRGAGACGSRTPSFGAQSAKQRLKKYQKDRGITDRNRPRAGRIRGLVPDERGAGRELSPMADQVPPV